MSGHEIFGIAYSEALVFAGSFCLFIFAILLELAISRKIDTSDQNIARNLGLFFITSFGFAVILPLLGYGTSAMLNRYGLHGLFLPKTFGGSLTAFLAAFIVYTFISDFFQYWTHRLMHKHPWLWRFHRVHHSDTVINASTEFRRSLGEGIILYAATAPFMGLIFGPDYVAAIILPNLAFVKVWGYVNHLNARIPFGPLTPVISGPQFHRLHHGIDGEFHNCNYSAFFPVLDVLFGTYRRPRKDEYPAVGVNDDVRDINVVQQALLPSIFKAEAK